MKYKLLWILGLLYSAALYPFQALRRPPPQGATLDLKNRWMNDANVLAQFAHVGWTFAIVSNVGWLFGNAPCLYTAVGLALYAVVKEWVYDANFEIPAQTWKDNLLDMSMLWLGTSLGLAMNHFGRAWVASHG